ncbi:MULTISPECIES: hypothetical protein [Streptomyces]|uniref:Uncharacterized protein n=1 Tax=Streptomyces cyaneofuscatus TaxID=66883 RepID=A0ABZ1F170_9ACTN|nr:hypothetical protein [Streptomyces cyaneofuscatus]WSB10151.1 hypothetical protein OG849_24385 [Streptomyces cyaneofuscatus]WSD46316.1 hypothetical protein OG857_11020 [Streptomyces cyaneofuscatus]WTA89693.1 hypothetical protein OG323_12040 [Streptomyces cyaneofuscatus]
MNRIATVVLAGAAASVMLATPAVATPGGGVATAKTPAQAAQAAPAGERGISADPMCNRGTHKLTWTNKKTSWVVTHRSVLENYTGGTATKTRKAEKVKEVGASVKATAGAKVSGKVVLASLEGSVGLELQAEGKRTKKSSESVTFKVKKNGTYVFYAGTKKAGGYYTQWRCDGGTKWIKTGRHGKAQSWTVKTEGGVRCGAKVSKKSLAAVVKKKYC